MLWSKLKSPYRNSSYSQKNSESLVIAFTPNALNDQIFLFFFFFTKEAKGAGFGRILFGHMDQGHQAAEVRRVARKRKHGGQWKGRPKAMVCYVTWTIVIDHVLDSGLRESSVSVQPNLWCSTVAQIVQMFRASNR